MSLIKQHAKSPDIGSAYKVTVAYLDKKADIDSAAGRGS
jgi:hypothetical protein